MKTLIKSSVSLLFLVIFLVFAVGSSDEGSSDKSSSDKLSSKGIKIKFVDERWSSKAAKRSMKDQGIKTGHNKSLVDQTAAAIFLQQYLDQK